MRVATNRAGILLAIMRPGQLKSQVFFRNNLTSSDLQRWDSTGGKELGDNILNDGRSSSCSASPSRFLPTLLLFQVLSIRLLHFLCLSVMLQF